MAFALTCPCPHSAAPRARDGPCRLFFMLTRGCGRTPCPNAHCASNPGEASAAQSLMHSHDPPCTLSHSYTSAYSSQRLPPRVADQHCRVQRWTVSARRRQRAACCCSHETQRWQFAPPPLR